MSEKIINGYDIVDNEKYVRYEDFVTLLKQPDCQQPPAGEWTKTFREKISDYRSIHNVGILDDAEIACDRLDRAEAINKDLLEACENNEKMLNVCAKVFLGTGEPPDPEEFANTILDNKAAIAKSKKG